MTKMHTKGYLTMNNGNYSMTSITDNIVGLLEYINELSKEGLIVVLLIISIMTVTAAISALLANERFKRNINQFINNSIKTDNKSSNKKTKNIYAQKIEDNITSVKENNIIVKKDLSNLLYDLIDSAQSRFFARQLTGVILPTALVFTFLLIAASLPGLAKALKELSSNSGSTSAALESFSTTITTISSKFIVSVAGLAGSILSTTICSMIESKTKEKIIIDSTEIQMRYNFRTESEIEIEKSERLLLAIEKQLEYTKSTAENTKKIDNMVVTVNDFSEEVFARLDNMVNNSLIERLAALSQKQTEELKQIANTITDSFASRIDSSMQQIVDVLERNVEALSEKVVQQGEGQVDSILTKLESLVSGGMSTQASDLRSTFDEMKNSLPQVVDTLKTQLASITDQRNEDSKRSENMMNQMIKTTETQQLFVDQMKNDITTMSRDIQSFANKLFEEQKDSMQGFAQKFIKANTEELLNRLETFETENTAQELKRNKAFEDNYQRHLIEQREIMDTLKNLGKSSEISVKATEKLLNDFSLQTASKLSESLNPVLRDVKTLQQSLQESTKAVSGTLESVAKREQSIQSSIEAIKNAFQQINQTTTKLEQVGQTFESSVEGVRQVMSDIPNSAIEINKTLKSQMQTLSEQKANLEGYSQKIIQVMASGTSQLAEKYKEIADQSSTLADNTLSKVNDELSDLSSTMKKLSATIESRINPR